MPGIALWHSIPCRSVLSVFRWLGRDFGVPVDVFVAEDLSPERRRLGWRSDEYSDLNWKVMPPDEPRLEALVEQRKGMIHLLNGYQRGAKMRRLGRIMVRKGIVFGGFSEAPLNFHEGLGRLLKTVYLKAVLRYRVAEIVRAARFVVNLSGPDSAPMISIGWAPGSIIPFGYFPERLPIDSLHLAEPSKSNGCSEHLRVLVTGNFDWHRGHATAIRAVALCKAVGLRIELRMAGDGPMMDSLRNLSRALGVGDDVIFLGLLPLVSLQAEICTCDCVIGSGVAEPWGIRVNDAVLLGKVCFVSDGMGVGQYIREIDARLAYAAGDHRMLSDRLVRFARDPEHRDSLQRVAHVIAPTFEPRYQARILYHELKERYEGVSISEAR